jgi:hypothetical protein
LIAPVLDTEMCTGTARMENSVVTMSCEDLQAAVAHLPATYTDPNEAWDGAFTDPIGDAVGLTRAPQQPGRCSLVAEQATPDGPHDFSLVPDQAIPKVRGRLSIVRPCTPHRHAPFAAAWAKASKYVRHDASLEP